MTRLGRLVLAGLPAFVLALHGMARAEAPGAFSQRCAVCHQPSGAGIPGIYPPLAGTLGKYVRVPEGRAYLIHVLLFGMNGPIVSQGAKYEGLMPSAADFSNEELAAALDYVLEKLNARQLPRDFKPITAAEFESARAASLTQSQVLREREELFSALEKTARGGAGR